MLLSLLPTYSYAVEDFLSSVMILKTNQFECPCLGTPKEKEKLSSSLACWVELIVNGNENAKDNNVFRVLSKDQRVCAMTEGDRAKIIFSSSQAKAASAGSFAKCINIGTADKCLELAGNFSTQFIVRLQETTDLIPHAENVERKAKALKSNSPRSLCAQAWARKHNASDVVEWINSIENMVYYKQLKYVEVLPKDKSVDKDIHPVNREQLQPASIARVKALAADFEKQILLEIKKISQQCAENPE